MYLCVCLLSVCGFVCMCMHACVRVCVCMCMRACVLAQYSVFIIYFGMCVHSSSSKNDDGKPKICTDGLNCFNVVNVYHLL